MDDHPMGLGHNSPPPYDPPVLEAMQQRANELDAAGKVWQELGSIDTAEDAEELTDFIGQLRTAFAKAEAERKAQKKPHDDRAKAVDAAFNPIKAVIEGIADKMKKMQAGYLAREKAKADAIKAAERAEAERQRAEAAEAARRAEAEGNAVAAAAAAAAQKEADKAAKAAERPATVNVRSATGGARTISLRVSWRPEIGNRTKAISHYRDHPEMTALILKLAAAERRHGGEDCTVPGINFIPEETAA